jgi:uncharacterized protein (TIGR00730 family)
MEPAHAPPAAEVESAARAERPAVCVFCGARSGSAAHWSLTAFDFGAAVARRGWRLVYGGGRVGLMGALADGALSAGGEVVGVIPTRLMERELAHGKVAELEVVVDMAARKQRMLAISDAFVALPGGLGTLDELFEVLTLRQIGDHAKPSALLDERGYWQPLLRACHAMVDAGFVPTGDVASLIVESDAGVLLDRLAAAIAETRRA